MIKWQAQAIDAMEQAYAQQQTDEQAYGNGSLGPVESE